MRNRDAMKSETTRWALQSPEKTIVWNYFNEKISKNIIESAIKDKYTLSQLYHRLAIAS